MTDPTPTTDLPQAAGFSYATALATLAALFLFLGVMIYVHRSNLLGHPSPAPAADPVEKLDAVRARNKAVLDGHDPTVKLSVDQAAAALLDHTAKTKDDKAPHGRLPFPAEPKKP
jgi:hypothetical protein